MFKNFIFYIFFYSHQFYIYLCLVVDSFWHSVTLYPWAWVGTRCRGCRETHGAKTERYSAAAATQPKRLSASRSTDSLKKSFTSWPNSKPHQLAPRTRSGRNHDTHPRSVGEVMTEIEGLRPNLKCETVLEPLEPGRASRDADIMWWYSIGPTCCVRPRTN